MELLSFITFHCQYNHENKPRLRYKATVGPKGHVYVQKWVVYLLTGILGRRKTFWQKGFSRYRNVSKQRMLSVKSSVWKSFSCVRLFVTPWTVAHKTPLSTDFSRKEYWSGLPFPSPGDLPESGVEPRSPTLQADSLPSESNGTWKLKVLSKPRSHKKFEMQENDLDGRKDKVVWKHRKHPFSKLHFSPQSALYCASFTVHTDFSPLGYRIF